MTTITVKNIPADLYEQLRLTARLNHRSINSQIIACIERSVGNRPIDVTAFMADARRLREMTAAYVITDEELDAAKSEGRP